MPGPRSIPAKTAAALAAVAEAVKDFPFPLAIAGGEFVPAGMMVACHSRGEGPR